jgi:hypothetical protein
MTRESTERMVTLPKTAGAQQSKKINIKAA